jgi:type 1 fimbria pilin
MRNLFLGALLLVTAACGAYHFPGGTTTSGTGVVSGRVTSFPCSPVEQAGDACAGRPAAGIEIDFSNAGSAAQAVTDTTGAYSIDLAPGTWKVKLKTYMRIMNGPSAVTVVAGSSVVANYIIDSGIRLPVPQQ